MYACALVHCTHPLRQFARKATERFCGAQNHV